MSNIKILLFQVVSVSVVTEKLKFDGSTMKIAECVVGDSTGVANLIARNGIQHLY